MVATVHPLFSGNSETKAPAHPVLTALRDGSLKLLDDVVRRMFDSADDALFEMGEKAPNDAERRRYFDTMRVLRIDRNRVAREFSQQIADGFVVSADAAEDAGFDLDALSIQPTEELEERIALGNLATKIEGLYKNLIWDLERRLEIAHARGIPIAPQALSPARICEAFGHATDVLDTEFQVKLVVFKLFDRVLTRDIEPVYRAAIELLEREGMDARRSASVVSRSVDQPGVAPSSPHDLLRQYGVDPASLGIGNDPAARPLNELLQALLTRGGYKNFESSAQRLAMAGQLFNELLAEPLLSQNLRSEFEPLRYPIYRTALADPAFFTSPMHPTRKMLGDLVALATATQTGEVSRPQFRELLQSMIGQAEGAADVGLGPLAQGPGLAGGELELFLRQLREQARERRTALLQHVRRLISQELELRTIGRDLPAPVLSLLRSGIGPLMAVRLLKSGRGSESFRNAEGLLERIVTALEAAPPIEDEEAQRREQLLVEIETTLRDIGMADERVTSLAGGLRSVFGTLKAPVVELGIELPLNDLEKARLMSDFSAADEADFEPAPEAEAGSQAEAEAALEPVQPLAPAAAPSGADSSLPKITALELLSRVLTPESWFRVYDANHNQTRWLKLASFYAKQDSVTFTGFDESTQLSLRASRLVDDLVHGHSEPINPTASAREALEQLRQARSRGLL